MKKIPKKNYIYVTILSLFTIILTFYLSNLYLVNKRSENKISFVSEIKENELKSYLDETHEIIIYMSESKNKANDKLEEELKKYTQKNNLEDKYLYLDLSMVSSNFYNEFYVNYINEAYKGNFEIKDPTIIYIKNKKVESYNNNIKDIKDIKKFFYENEVIE